ncbi:hypothetical protein FB446DRAFT_800700 [Lentinula raphanica]|nr:hypothetical protein FB446DRAFT_800700 [Lentinula raphanica]
MSLHFTDARLIENGADPTSNMLKYRGIYVFTLKELHILERFISKSDRINSDHLLELMTRSMSTGNAEDLHAQKRGAALRGQDSQFSLGANTSPSGWDGALSEEIAKELEKDTGGKKDFILEHEGTI